MISFAFGANVSLAWCKMSVVVSSTLEVVLSWPNKELATLCCSQNWGKRRITNLWHLRAGSCHWVDLTHSQWMGMAKALWPFPVFWSTTWISFFFFFLNLFYWSIVDLQCCVNLYCTTQWFSYTYIYILFHIPLWLSQAILYSSMCSTVGPRCLSILCIMVYIANPKPPIHPSPTPVPLGNHKSVLYVCESVYFYIH